MGRKFEDIIRNVPEGRIAPHIQQGLDQIEERIEIPTFDERHFQSTPPQRKPPKDIFQITHVYEISPPGGSGGSVIGNLEDQVNFPLRTVLVDNLTSRWLYVNAARKFVAPNTVGAVLRCLAASQKLQCQWVTPVGYTQQAVVAGQVAVIQGYEGLDIGPSSGQDISGQVAGAGDTNVNVDQMGGQAIASPFSDAVDGAATGSALQAVLARGVTFNGATWDRARSMGAAGDGLGVALASQPASTAVNDSPAVNVAAVITIAAVAGQRNRLTSLNASYNAAPTGGNLLVQDGATTIYSLDVAVAGSPPVDLPQGGLKGSVNTAMTVTLAAAGAAVTGKVNVSSLTA